ncbi:hypothetical protein MD484_g2138, partial [Candolleomyces efflorescens]
MPPRASTSKTMSSVDEKTKGLVHHPQYYLLGGDLFVQIGTTIFKIHSYFFKREAKNFYTKLLDPVSPGDEKRGTCESNAIQIESATVEEFEHFLWVFYNPLYDVYDADIAVWFTILRLAHQWVFPQVTEFALREIKRREDEVELVPRIVLYHKYNAPPEYLVPLYAQLCARATTPTDEETALLGIERTLKVFVARERIRSSGGISPLPKGLHETDTYPAISSVLGLPEYKGSPFEQEAAINDTPIVKPPVAGKKNSSGRTSGTK